MGHTGSAKDYGEVAECFWSYVHNARRQIGAAAGGVWNNGVVKWKRKAKKKMDR